LWDCLEPREDEGTGKDHLIHFGNGNRGEGACRCPLKGETWHPLCQVGVGHTRGEERKVVAQQVLHKKGGGTVARAEMVGGKGGRGWL